MHQQDPQPALPVIDLQHRTDIQPLTGDEIRFEIDMCIGCDRCMYACPVPLSTQVSIAELNNATVSNDIPAKVARFTDECVMCGSCVPVCPVDNHRDLLMLSLKQRLGIPWKGEVDMSRLLRQLPPGWDHHRLLRRLREQPMFHDPRLVLDNYLLHVIAASRVLALQPGELCIQEGQFGRELYLILDGRVELVAQNDMGEHLPVAILRRGEYFGEDGLLNGQPRSLTARVLGPSIILEVPEQVIQRLGEIVPPVQQFITQLGITRSIETHLKRLALFQGVSTIDIRRLAEQASIRRYDRNEQLFSEHTREQGVRESLHLLLEGFVKVARKTTSGTGRAKTDERIIAYRQGGDYFAGGLDMLGDRKAVTVTAITRVNVAQISRALLMPLFARYPEVKQRFQQQLQQYQQAVAAAYSAVFEPMAFTNAETVNPLSDAGARAGLHSLVDDGVVEGKDVLVIDLDKCIHCNECEEACERRHGHSRMNRKGMVVGNISIATACRQCQDPVCMLCSRAGIARMPGGEIYITESCIGCGICAERCPYDNISIITLDEKEDSVAQSSWQRFSTFFSKGAGKERGQRIAGKPLPVLASPHTTSSLPSTDALSEMRKKIAIKCDLCAGYENQACVQACPTGAAFRVNPVSFFGSTEDILRRRAT